MRFRTKVIDFIPVWRFINNTSIYMQVFTIEQKVTTNAGTNYVYIINNIVWTSIGQTG